MTISSQYHSIIEKQLQPDMDMMEITGKKRRKVPVLMTEEIKTALTLLISSRAKVGINPKNPYIFALQGDSLGYMKGHQCLREVVEELGSEMQNPEAIKGSLLRKPTAN